MRAVSLFATACLILTPLGALAQAPESDRGFEGLPGVEDILPPDFQDEPEGSAIPEPAPEDAAPQPGAELAPLPAPVPDVALSPAERLDALFAELKREPNAAAAARIARRIEAQWAESGSATVDLLVGWAGEAIAKDNKPAALDLLGEAIAMKPDHAESWNRRATLHFLADDYGKSLADIEQTLRREPRHYGALMGLGAILEETDRKPQALDAYMKVLAIYPTMKPAQDAVARLSEELSERAI